MEYSDWLPKLHDLELMIAKEVKRICEKNNIKYYLIAGSLLGAVRHGGFIPWDDDMDIGMLRADYDQFIKVCEEELDKRFFLQTWDTDSEYPMPYAKIRLRGTHFVEAFSESANMNNGIFVDIFPYDNAPDSILLRKAQGIKYFTCSRMLWIKKGMGKNIKAESRMKNLKYTVFSLVSNLFSYDNTKKYFEHTLRKYNKKDTKGIVIAYDSGSSSYESIIIKREWADQCECVKFEQESFNAFSKRDEYLSYIYGDYMRLPPPEERQGHVPVQIDFGIYT